MPPSSPSPQPSERADGPRTRRVAARVRVSARTESAARAEVAARAVVDTFGGPLVCLPGTHLARCARPSFGPLDVRWQYWWQAHYVDAVVDVGRRRLAGGDIDGARAWTHRGRRLLRTIWLRNGARITNSYYDDMAWLILAAARLQQLAVDAGIAPGRLAGRAVERLSAQLSVAHTRDLGGGLFWTTRHDRKNVAASGPAAIHFARSGRGDRAGAILEWIDQVMRDPESGLMLDTLYMDGRRDDTVYTYNQGVVIGALLAHGTDASLARAAELVHLVDGRLRARPDTPVLRGHGGGDGGLFTGILVRYLALAAQDVRLEQSARDVAAGLVHGTAQALWDGRGPRGPHDPTPVFSPEPSIRVQPAPIGQQPVELSSQLQAWTILEAAAALPATDPTP
ncbi:MAG: glycoside hydrolase family 76 protein [Dermatophilaceae bacterium]